ncbi:MAG: chloride channel protein [Planctomycetaceae bacterium]|nr:chloride channel protein [Planctomycetaceae bacterium]
MIRRRVVDLVDTFELQTTGKWFFLSTLIGCVAGAGAILFQLLTHYVVKFSLARFANYLPGEALGEPAGLEIDELAFAPWTVVIVMTVGGLLSGFLVYTFAPEAEGHGTDAAIESFHNKRGRIKWQIPLVKTISSAITLGTGGSAGREGPIAQIGAGFGSLLATRLKLSARDRRIMLASGMAAGVGAIFRAPLAGALFGGEILYKDGDLESDVIVPAAISSIISYSVYSMILPPELRFIPLFGEPPEFVRSTMWDLIPFGLLSIVLVLVGILYIKIFYGTHNLFQKIPVKKHFRPAIGAAMAGLLAMGLYYGYSQNMQLLAVLSTGYGVLQGALTDSASVAPVILVTVALFKIITTSLTISSGGSGGVFGPSMVIGGCMGGAIGQLFAEYGPEWWTDQPESYAIVGMAGFFAGIARAPFSTIIMVSEMTGSYHLLLPTMWVSTICFLLSHRWTIYIKQVPSRLESSAHRGDFIIDLLEGILVEDVYQRDRQLCYVHESMSLEDIVHLLSENEQQYFPVVNDDQKMIGIFSANDVRAYLYDETIWRLANARDVMVSNLVTLSPEDDLNSAMHKFTSLNLEELPVIDPDDPGHLLGMLRRKETIAAYNQRMVEMKQQIAEQE